MVAYGIDSQAVASIRIHQVAMLIHIYSLDQQGKDECGTRINIQRKEGSRLLLWR